MKILVLGAGRMGFGAAYDLAHNSDEVDKITVLQNLTREKLLTLKAIFSEMDLFINAFVKIPGPFRSPV